MGAASRDALRGRVELVANPVVKLIMRHEAHTLDAIAEAARELAGDEGSVIVPGP